MESLSPFAGCRTADEIRAQLDALNRLAYGVAHACGDAPPRKDLAMPAHVWCSSAPVLADGSHAKVGDRLRQEHVARGLVILVIEGVVVRSARQVCGCGCRHRALCLELSTGTRYDLSTAAVRA